VDPSFPCLSPRRPPVGSGLEVSRSGLGADGNAPTGAVVTPDSTPRRLEPPCPYCRVTGAAPPCLAGSAPLSPSFAAATAGTVVVAAFSVGSTVSLTGSVAVTAFSDGSTAVMAFLDGSVAAPLAGGRRGTSGGRDHLDRRRRARCRRPP
jgi:hypothetical protein